MIAIKYHGMLKTVLISTLLSPSSHIANEILLEIPSRVTSSKSPGI